MPRRRHILQTGAVGLAALAGCATFAPGGASEQLTETVDPGSAGQFAAFTPNGRVTVEGTDTSSVMVEATKRTGGEAAELDKIAVVAEVVDDTVEVRVEKSTPEWPRVAVDLSIELPQRLVTTAVRTGNGPIDLTDTRGSTRVETGNGRVSMTNHAGFPRVTSGNGDVTVTGGPGVRHAWTGNGSVDVEIRDIQDESSLVSGNGTLTARVAGDLACALELDTGTGEVDTGSLDVATTASRRGHLFGTLNGGSGDVLKATTGNGDITLRPLDE